MRRKTILVTGGAGYIGSHMVRLLLKKDFDVVVFDSLENGSKEAIKRLRAEKPSSKLYFVQGDIRKKEDLDSVFKKYKIDAIIHFAAYLEAGESMYKPLKYFENNVNGTVNLISVALSHGVKKIIASSTAAVYGEKNKNPVKEDGIIAPENYYGLSKYIVEQILMTSVIEGLQSIRFRYFNAAGNSKDSYIGLFKKNPSNIIPRIVQYALGKRDDFMLFGDDYPTPDGTCIRDYIDVNDLAEAHLLGLKKLFSLKDDEKYTDVFNLGTGKGTSNLELIKIIKKISKIDFKYKTVERRKGDASVLVADSTKAFKILGWKAKVPIEKTIEEVLKWNKKI